MGVYSDIVVLGEVGNGIAVAALIRPQTVNKGYVITVNYPQTWATQIFLEKFENGYLRNSEETQQRKK